MTTGREGRFGPSPFLTIVGDGLVGPASRPHPARVFFLDKSLEVMTDERLARLMTFPNVLVASHQAYFTRDAVGRIAETTVRNIEDHFAGLTSDNTLVRPGFG